MGDTTSSRSESVTPSTVTPATAKPTADASLTWPVYRAAGVPDITRDWSVEDYQIALRALGRMLAQGRADLPRQGSERSGPVFARLVAPGNFGRITTESSAEARARLGEAYLSVFPGLLQLYAPANDGLDFAAEQSALIVTLLELLKSTLHASHVYAAGDARWRDTYERQKSVTVGVLQGVRAMLAEDTRYSPAVRAGVKRDVTRLGPELASHLDDEGRRLALDGGEVPSR
jgi:hypothetical protein